MLHRGRAARAFGVIVLAGCSTAQSEQVGTEDTRAEPIRIQPAESALRPRVTTASGVVRAKTEVDVAFQVGGKVIRAGPDEGSAVRAGEPLAEIDPTDYRLGVAQATAVAERAAQERERYAPLLSTGSVAANDYERLESGARQSAAAAALARKRLSDTRLVSPISGIVSRRAVEPGATASPGRPVFTIVDVNPVRVRIGVAESDVATVHVGQRAEIRVPAFGDAAFAGRVSLVGIAADSLTHTYAVEISVPNPSQRLKVGMVAEASIYGEQLASAITVPAGAVTRDADGTTRLFVLDARSSTARARRVEIGAGRGGGIEIVRGLAGGEPVIVAGQHRLRDGTRVQVTTTDTRAGGVGGAR